MAQVETTCRCNTMSCSVSHETVDVTEQDEDAWMTNSHSILRLHASQKLLDKLDENQYDHGDEDMVEVHDGRPFVETEFVGEDPSDDEDGSRSYYNDDEDEETNHVDEVEESRDEPVIQAEARAINPSFCRVGVHEMIAEAAAFGCTRPAFLFARLQKTSPDMCLGISFKSNKYGGGCYISHLESGSLFERAHFRTGDRVISVNGVGCRNFGAHTIAKIIKASLKEVSMVVYNSEGDAGLVSNCVQKPKANMRVGVAFQNSRHGLFISRVKEDGLFENSLLLAGHRCVMINETVCPTLFSVKAAQLVTETVELVTITCRPSRGEAMVLALDPEKKSLWKGAKRAFQKVTCVKKAAEPLQY